MKIIHILPVNNLSLEKPASILNGFPVPTVYHMVLTHLVEEDINYTEHYANLGDADYKILDNSLIELGGAVHIERVVKAAERIRANEIILPDVFQKGPETIEAVKKAIEWLYANGLLDKYKLMAVAQGRNYVEWVQCFAALEEMPEIDVIGIPKILAKMHPAGRPAFESVWAHSSKIIHLLGLWYSWEELKVYKHSNKIRTVDTILATFQAKYNLSIFEVRPDGYSVDLKDFTIRNEDIRRVINRIGDEI